MMNHVTEPARILIADDDEGLRWVLRKTLQGAGHKIEEVADGEAAIELLAAMKFDVALVDIRMPKRDGFEVLEATRAMGPDAPHLVLLTAQDTVKTAIEAMKRGAFEYLAKPFDIDEIELLVNRAVNNRRLQDEVTRLRQAHPRPEHPDELGLVGKSRKMREIFKTIGQVAPTDETVLITGESGTGKELVARALHAHSTRSQGPFIALNCAAIPAELVESELFGSSKGAYTGATGDRPGRFEVASRGTLLLDELGELPLATQAKLLRVIQSREYTRLGSPTTLRFDARILAATNRDLALEVKEGRFRSDLYYRLQVVEICLPPLRERPEDIEVLVQYFAQQIHKHSSMEPKEISEEALNYLKTQMWPGNVRELENSIRRAMVLARSRTLEKSDFTLLPPTSLSGPGKTESPDLLAESMEDYLYNKLQSMLQDKTTDSVTNLREQVLSMVDRPLINLALEKTNGNKLRAAKLLGVNRNTLRSRMKELEIKDSDESKS